MAISADAEQLENINQEPSLSESEESLNKANKLYQLRREIGLVADEAYREKYISKKAHEGYQEDKLEAFKTEKSLESVLKFAREDVGRAEECVTRLKDFIRRAMADKVASDVDEEYLLSTLILSDENNMTEDVEEILLKKIKNMHREKGIFIEFQNHSLIKNTGFIKTDERTKIEFPDEKAFLKLTVPERRVLLKKIEDALPKAEAYAKEHGEIESTELTEEYTKLLNKAERKNLLGEKSIQKFLDGFKKIDNIEKAHWIKELKNGNELERYKTFWKSVQKTFKGEARTRMEDLRDQLGYSELLKAFGREQEKESQKMTTDYTKRLTVARQHKLISLHTFKAYRADMKAQSFNRKQHYLDQFENKMRPYAVLRAQIDQIKNSAVRNILNKMYESDQSGLTEIRSAYRRLTGQAKGAAPSGQAIKRSEKILSTVTSTFVKGGIVHLGKVLDKNQRNRYAKSIIQFITGRVRKNEDATNYQNKIQRSRLIQEAEHGNAESITNKTDDGTYQKDAFKDKKGVHRVTRVGDTKEAVRAFLSDSSFSAKNDDLSVMFKSGKIIVELDTQQKRASAEYLQAINEEEMTVAANEDEEEALAA